ncbi:MAG: MBL fold metallo-hydrolase, partial [Leptospiraceae bacterium]|nr:MBL fold metallo-hydrolase [Leptospiraceae bacterium]
DPNSIDCIYFTHFHADHFFGLPALLTRWWEENRKKPLTILGQIGTEEFAKNLIEEAYPGVFWDYEGKNSDKIGEPPAQGTLKKPHFQINFIESDTSFQLEKIQIYLARTNHSRKNLAIRIESTESKKSFAFSGDGDFTNESLKLFSGLDFLVHEAYLFDKNILGHGSIIGVVENAKKQNIKNLALVHINRIVRRSQEKEISNYIKKSKINCFIPLPGDIFEI